jgi:hypothetical protein
MAKTAYDVLIAQQYGIYQHALGGDTSPLETGGFYLINQFPAYQPPLWTQPLGEKISGIKPPKERTNWFNLRKTELLNNLGVSAWCYGIIIQRESFVHPGKPDELAMAERAYYMVAGEAKLFVITTVVAHGNSFTATWQEVDDQQGTTEELTGFNDIHEILINSDAIHLYHQVG